MKYLFFLFVVLFTHNTIYSQVGINTSNPNTNAALDIRGTNQGIIIPSISLQSRNNSNQLLTPPKESLMFYNTNNNIPGGKAFYFWNGTAWDFVFNDTNINMLENLISYNTKTANPNTVVSSNNYDGSLVTNGSDINNTWTVLNELNETIVVNRPNNNILMGLSGMIQMYNGSSITGTIQILVGMFINDKLVNVSPLYFPIDGDCSARSFKVQGIAQNVINTEMGQPTVPYTANIKFAFKNFSKSLSSNSATPTIVFGNKHSNCTNISSDEANLSSSAILIQPFNF